MYSSRIYSIDKGVHMNITVGSGSTFVTKDLGSSPAWTTPW